MGGHPSRPAVAGRLERSTRRHRAGRPRTPARDGGEPPSFLDLPQGGVYRATPVTRCAVVSYAAVSPLPVRALAVCSLWHCPAGHPGSLLTPTLHCGARTFLGGSVSPTDATAQPTRPSRQESTGLDTAAVPRKGRRPWDREAPWRSGTARRTSE